MFSVLFGLSMDYEVYLVARMHENGSTADPATALSHSIPLTVPYSATVTPYSSGRRRADA
jgi:uncharacterized membrane protein YdfJ with MMPL/SSD domain